MMTKPKFDSNNTARAVNDHEAAIRNGFSATKTFYEVGWPVNEVGRANAGKFRREWEALPTAVEALESFRDMIRGEDRRDHTVNATDLTMGNDGLIYHRDMSNALPLTERAWASMASLVMPSYGGPYLRVVDPPLRSYNFNEIVKRICNKEVNCKSDKDKKKVNLRWRTRGGQDEIFACTGQRYTAFDGDRIATLLLDGLNEPGLRADISYEGYKVKIDLIYSSNVSPNDFVAGEYFRATVSLEFIDDGTGSIECYSSLLRNLCLNLIRLGKVKQFAGRQIHVGDTAKIAGGVGDAILKAYDSIGYFAQKWNDANLDNIFEKVGCDDPEKLFRGLVVNKVVWIPNMRSDDQVQLFMDAWSREPGYSRASVINAITRAHELQGDSWVMRDLEEQAGAMLYQKVWNVELPDESATA